MIWPPINPTFVSTDGSNGGPVVNAPTSQAMTPTQAGASALDVITNGLGALAWFDKIGNGGLTGNPGLRRSWHPEPAVFEIALNQTTLPKLSSATDTIRVKLNTSIQTFNLRSQQTVHRTPTSVGLMMSFWNAQPDTITGRGSTGIFLNAFGLAALMSNNLTPATSRWFSMLKSIYAAPAANGQGFINPFSSAPTPAPTSPGLSLMGTALLGVDGGKQAAFRVAAQDAFAELLALFKNNGVIRFTNPTNPLGGRAALANTLNSGVPNPTTWSASEGATGFQMAARIGDVRRRGYVVFKYKGGIYLGYFKSLNLTADANTPFQWNFDFTFRVERSLVTSSQFSQG